jgi:hypothetical protein
MATPTQRDYNAYYEGLNTLEMIQEVQRWLGVGLGDYDRYSKDEIITALNQAGLRFVKRTGCITMPVVIICAANRQSYRLPYNTLFVISGRYYTAASRTAYEELEIHRDMKRVQRIDSSFRGTTGTPRYLFPSYSAGNVPTIGVSPFPATAGDAWTGSAFGVLTSATGFTVAGNITGTHSAGYPNSAFLVDSAGRDLTTLGASTGYPVFNVADGSSGIITAIGDAAATNDKVTATLAGGADNDWDEGDSFQIPMGEYGVVLDAAMEETYMMTSAVGTIADIYGFRGNLVLDVARKPLPLSSTYDDFFSEIPEVYHEAQVAWAVYWIGRGEFQGVSQKAAAAEGRQRFEELVLEYQSSELAEATDNEVEDRLDWY